MNAARNMATETKPRAVGLDGHLSGMRRISFLHIRRTAPGLQARHRIKRGLTPKIECGFHLAVETVQPERGFVVYGGAERFPLAPGVEAVPLEALCQELAAS